MSIRLRLSLFTIFLGIIPLLVVYLFMSGISSSLHQAIDRLVQATLTQETQRVAVDRARMVADQIKAYLEENPAAAGMPSDLLASDAQLAKIAVQTVGPEDTTLVITTAGRIVFHQDESLVGQNFYDLATNPAAGGFYDLKSSSGESRRVYLVFTPITGSALQVVAPLLAEQVTAPGQGLAASLVDEFRNSLVSFGVVVVFIALVTVGVGLYLVNELTAPIRWAAAVGERAMMILQGMSKNIQPPGQRSDIDLLSYTLGVIEKQVMEEYTNLERQVKARTSELALRTEQLETAALIARDAAEILDVRQLLNQACRLISGRFNYYHTGIFLLDENKEYAVLQAANSDGGQRMLGRGHKLRVGQVGIVGYTAQSGEARIALDVGADAVHFRNPDLPETRSEVALPMKARGMIIGVLDVQSTAVSAFTDADVKILQIVADQIGLALDNARLLEESQRAYQELQNLYGSQSQLAWAQRLKGDVLAYVYNHLGVSRASKDYLAKQRLAAAAPVDEDGGRDDPRTFVVPITLSHRKIGAITLRRSSEQEPWGAEDQLLIQNSAEQIASALEVARLLEEVQRRARHESLVGQISSELQKSAVDLDAVLRTAVQEIGQRLDVDRVQIRLGNPSRG